VSSFFTHLCEWAGVNNSMIAILHANDKFMK
jgi:hypothetical protein